MRMSTNFIPRRTKFAKSWRLRSENFIRLDLVYKVASGLMTAKILLVRRTFFKQKVFRKLAESGGVCGTPIMSPKFWRTKQYPWRTLALWTPADVWRSPIMSAADQVRRDKFLILYYRNWRHKDKMFRSNNKLEKSG